MLAALTRKICTVLKGIFVTAWVCHAAPVAASTYYFDDCATGGTGEIGTPYCLDPGSTGRNVTVIRSRPARAGPGTPWT